MEYLQKEFIPYDRALKMKALGFDEPCFGFYHIDSEEGKILLLSDNEYFMQGVEFSCNAPTFSQTFRWFREKYGYNSYISEALKNCYIFIIEKWEDKRFVSPSIYSYDEEAELACLDKLIEIVESKQKEDGG